MVIEINSQSDIRPVNPYIKNQANKPVIILVNPHVGENIGSVARVMANFGLSDLRIIKTSFTKEIMSKAKVLAVSHGLEILNNAKFFERVEDAIEDIDFLLAFTIRARGSSKQNYEVQDAMPIVVESVNKAGFMFGNEKWGLENDELELAHATCYIPSNNCLNLAQSVVVSAYQWFQDCLRIKSKPLMKPETATINDLNLFFDYAREKIELNGHVDPRRKDIICAFRDFCLRTYCTRKDLRLLYRVVEFLSEKKDQ